MKRKILVLLISFSSVCLSNDCEKPSIVLTESEKQTQLLEKQNQILKALFELQYKSALQAQQEKKHAAQKILTAQKNNNPSIIPAILSLHKPEHTITYPQNEALPLANQANIFYDSTLSSSEAALILAAEKFIIDTGYAYLWPTIRSIIINRIATKVTSIAFDALDDAADSTVGIRPWELLSSLTPEERAKNKQLRSPEIADLIAQRSNLKAQLTPAETATNLAREITQLEILLAQARDPQYVALLDERNSLLRTTVPTENTEKISKEVNQLRNKARLQQEERNARADSG
ncbi:MAG: hypothetical protein WCJ33_10265, partial [Pseudomonadota bacterium]